MQFACLERRPIRLTREEPTNQKAPEPVRARGSLDNLDCLTGGRQEGKSDFCWTKRQPQQQDKGATTGDRDIEDESSNAGLIRIPYIRHHQLRSAVLLEPLHKGI